MVKARIHQGWVIDEFVVGQQLHVGGMATLWEVTHPGFELPMLIKVPRLDEGEEASNIVSFEMEQMIVPRLSGRHVPKFVAVGDFATQPYIVVERIAGGTLQSTAAKAPLPYDEAANICARIAVALDDLHRQHVVHLDIKPGNIMFRPSGEAVLIDYGLAHHSQLPDLMHEEYHVPFGTAPYMAPEQILGNRRDGRSDIFAVGVLLYVLTTGSFPFGESETLRGMKRRLWRDPVPPRRLRRDYPPWLQEIVLRCLEVKPAWRYPTAAQLAFDLGHQNEVKLTARSERLQQDGWRTVMRRRFNPDLASEISKLAIAVQVSSAPIVAVAVDLQDGADDLNAALRETARRILDTVPHARLACLNVLKLGVLTLDTTLDDQGHNKHIERMVGLRHWVEPLRLDASRLTVHVLEAMDPAAAILEYAAHNRVDHILLGARCDSLRRAILGSVSAKIAAQADCTVTVVRAPRMRSADSSDATDTEASATAASRLQ